MANTVTNITILSNGTYSPNKTIALGNKYESVGDTITFNIPSEYIGYHHYLTFKMGRRDTVILPVNYINNVLTFFITATITKYSGTYEIVFLSTESQIVDGDIDEARMVFVSNVMTGTVTNNFLTDPVTSEELDENLQVLYDDMLDLYDEFKEKLADGGFVGPYYIPKVDPLTGVISWTRSDNKEERIPDPVNITGPTGPYYIPKVTDGVLTWEKSATTIPDIESTDLNVIIANSTNAYLDANLSPLLDEKIPTEVTKQIKETFTWKWDAETSSFYIYIKDTDTTGE